MARVKPHVLIMRCEGIMAAVAGVVVNTTLVKGNTLLGMSEVSIRGCLDRFTIIYLGSLPDLLYWLSRNPSS